MQFRPCIDIHNGVVKQIVGGSLKDEKDSASENFVAQQNADYYANLYRKAGLSGGHIILLNPKSSDYYEATKAQALLALKAFPGGMQIGGGITDENAKEYIDAGASHVIVTSFVFYQGKVDYERLERLVKAVGREHIVLDLSCKKVDHEYYVVTERWQNLTQEQVNVSFLQKMEDYCDEFLIHAVDVEGKCNGIEAELVSTLSQYSGNALTYAGGISNFEDIRRIKQLGKGKIDVTIGSALDLFGGKLGFWDVINCCNE